MARGAGALVAAAVVCFFVDVPGFVSPLLTRQGSASRSRSLVPREAKDRDLDWSFGGVPVDVYADALADAAAATKEAVPVMQDMMYLKDMWEGGPAMEKWQELILIPMIDDLTMATRFVEARKADFKSTVVPKFIIFMAKKLRLHMLKTLSLRYVQKMYTAQSIAPVKVVSASALSEEQTKMIKDKMAKKLGVSDIKLLSTTNPDLVAGFKLYWDFEDPEQMTKPGSMQDSTFSTYLKEAALNQGILVE